MNAKQLLAADRPAVTQNQYGEKYTRLPGGAAATYNSAVI
jgi:hypothetical protein